MHPNAELMDRLFSSLGRLDHKAMASCYHEQATFRDIAFDLQGRRQIHTMWHMVCDTRIESTFEIVHADDHGGQVRVVDDYRYGAADNPPGRPVHNVIVSHLRFQDGLIIDHRDECDARAWAQQALGGVLGFLVGRIRILRSLAAKKKLAAFVKKHPECAYG